MIPAEKSLQDLGDDDLILQVSKGNSAALEELYNRYSQRLLHYLLHMLAANADKAQDFLQDVFLKVIEKAFTFRPRYKASTWLFSIARNLCRNEYRRLSTQATDSSDDLDGKIASQNWQTEDTDNFLDESNFKQTLLKKLYHYEPEQRSVFILRFQQELSIKEIAKIMNCAEGTVKSRLHYTTKRLAEELQIFNPIAERKD